MANALWDPGREGFLDGSINWATDTIKIRMLNGYVFSAAHKFLSDVMTGGVTAIGTDQTLGSKTVTSGVADAADPTYTAVADPGFNVTALCIFKDTGVAGTSRIIAFIDTATGLPVRPNGGDITVQFDNGANRIFKL